MSDYETHRGKAERVYKTLDELFSELTKNYDIPNYHQKPYSKYIKEDIIRDEFEDYIFTSKGIFHIIEDNIEDNDDIIEIDDDLNFHLKFYNGGCGFEEAFAEAVENNPNILDTHEVDTKKYQIEVNIGDCEFNESSYIIFNNRSDAEAAAKILEKAQNVFYAEITKI